jgi:hypothetical protein
MITSRGIVIASMAIYAAAVLTATIVHHRLTMREWANTWRNRMADRREAMRSEWLASEGVTNA